MRPTKSVLDLEVRSVKKRMKDKAFARAVSRDDLRRGAEELGLPLDEHVANVTGFPRERADALGRGGDHPAGNDGSGAGSRPRSTSARAR